MVEFARNSKFKNVAELASPSASLQSLVIPAEA